MRKSMAIFDNLFNYSKKFPFIRFFRSIPRADYLGLLKNCGILVGNSSSGIIEGSYFEIPVVNVGIRQEGRERGQNVTDVPDDDPNRLQKAILNSFKRKRKGKTTKYRIYGNGNSSKKIVKILEKTKLDKKLIQKQIFY